jgi:hypothetical protein
MPSYLYYKYIFLFFSVKVLQVSVYEVCPLLMVSHCWPRQISLVGCAAGAQRGLASPPGSSGRAHSFQADVSATNSQTPRAQSAASCNTNPTLSHCFPAPHTVPYFLLPFPARSPNTTTTSPLYSRPLRQPRSPLPSAVPVQPALSRPSLRPPALAVRCAFRR